MKQNRQYRSALHTVKYHFVKNLLCYIRTYDFLGAAVKMFANWGRGFQEVAHHLVGAQGWPGYSVPGAPAPLTTLHLSSQVPVASWFDNMSDTELHDLLPFFEQLSRVDDVYSVLRQPRPGS